MTYPPYILVSNPHVYMASMQRLPGLQFGSVVVRLAGSGRPLTSISSTEVVVVVGEEDSEVLEAALDSEVEEEAVASDGAEVSGIDDGKGIAEKGKVST